MSVVSFTKFTNTKIKKYVEIQKCTLLYDRLSEVPEWKNSELTNNIDGSWWCDLSAGVGCLDTVDSRVFALIQSTNLEGTRFSTVVSVRDDVLRVEVNTHTVLEPRHGRVRDARQVALQQQRRALRRVRRLQRPRHLWNNNFLLSFYKRTATSLTCITGQTCIFSALTLRQWTLKSNSSNLSYCTEDADESWQTKDTAVKSRGKAEHLYSALHGIQTTLKRSGMDHTNLPAINTMPAFTS